MRLLLDTHTFLWAITDDPKLGPLSRDLITNQASAVFLSHVSLWEIAIKHALTRGDMPLSAGEAIPWAEQSGFAFLPIGLPHLLALDQLPLHHRDPFDRLLVAQSISGPLTLLSADAAFTAYGCPLQDARA
ncbi:type II toxin-antitoxin system VapC family toxin [Cyanobium sp. N5-Cardenillas]|uniref:type II toxin-antitoxin system VapC family toxin n=1 Tax=Cyanobium sp. N5-Cardenillas TaxID=2823720 RepID=UPI0020CF04B5|nr:type II toxin-antitoxin system VapC family toxin [Cyanobium sp. N5-Cardenillas]MCP9785484.1 type II toxin-antitoxin system VapC family toxin [Cyanobium sp. N5-Cardenillas]